MKVLDGRELLISATTEGTPLLAFKISAYTPQPRLSAENQTISQKLFETSLLEVSISFFGPLQEYD